MNAWKAFAAPVCAGWHAMVRFPADAAARPVLGRCGAPEVYPTREAALQASVDSLTGYLNGRMTRCGEKATAHAEAHALFRPGKKPIQFEVR